MMQNFISTISLLILGASSTSEPNSTITAAPYINLFANLDEQNDVGWCLDLKGFGASIEFIDMQTHSCKDTGDDVNFAIGDGRVWGAGASEGRCLRARSAEAGSMVDVPLCNATDPLQDITYCADGTLRLNATHLCLAAGNESRSAGPKWMARDLNFEECDETPTELKTWAYLAVNSAERVVGGDDECDGESISTTSATMDISTTEMTMKGTNETIDETYSTTMDMSTTEMTMEGTDETSDETESTTEEPVDDDQPGQSGGFRFAMGVGWFFVAAASCCV